MRAHDRVRESTSTLGTGNLACEGAPSGYVTFASRYADGDRFRYSCAGGGEWETGIGHYDSSGNEIVREHCFESSNADDFVDFTATSKSIWVDHPAEMDNSMGLALALAQQHFMP